MAIKYKTLYNKLLASHLELSSLLVPTVMENNSLKAEVKVYEDRINELEERFQKANAAALKNLEKIAAKEIKDKKDSAKSEKS